MITRSQLFWFQFLFVLAFFCTNSATAEVIIKQSLGWRAIAADSSDHTCAITFNNGIVYCWGDNTTGQLGSPGTPTGLGNPNAYSTVPVQVLGLPLPAESIAVGYDYSCAVLSDGSVWCWGDNHNGTLGNGQLGASVNVVPSKVVGLQASAVSVAIAAYHACAVLTTGRVSCWGLNDASDVLGSPSMAIGSYALTPVVVPNTYAVMGLSANLDSTCAIGMNQISPAAGLPICWGDNSGAEGGQPISAGGLPPTFDLSLQDAVTITSGEFFTCAISVSKGAVCWGVDGEVGTLGDNSNCSIQSPITKSCSSPQAVVGIQGRPVAIAAGFATACAVGGAGSIWCWGTLVGAKGLVQSAYTATQIPTTTAATAVVVGNYHACALVNSGARIQCWGRNDRGQLGNGTTVDVPYNSTPSFVL